MPTTPTWLTSARTHLLALRSRDGGWGYLPQNSSAVEPTVLASLALLASGPKAESTAAAATAGRWIADHCRRADGSTTVSIRSDADDPGWTTPLALWLWNVLSGFESERAAAAAWLLQFKGKAIPPVPYNPMGHDTMLVGWPWVANTHSWVEPTASALLALASSVPSSQPRMAAGIHLLVDRAISTGGWNLGNPMVFGQTCRPLPGPTGLALIALRRLDREPCPRPVIDKALAYLRAVVQSTLAPTSLGWAVLGLRAWEGQLDPAVPVRLALAAERILARQPLTVELAMLLLASSDRSLPCFGILPTPAPEMAR